MMFPSKISHKNIKLPVTTSLIKIIYVSGTYPIFFLIHIFYAQAMQSSNHVVCDCENNTYGVTLKWSCMFLGNILNLISCYMRGLVSALCTFIFIYINFAVTRCTYLQKFGLVWLEAMRIFHILWNKVDRPTLFF